MSGGFALVVECASLLTVCPATLTSGGQVHVATISQPVAHAPRAHGREAGEEEAGTEGSGLPHPESSHYNFRLGNGYQPPLDRVREESLKRLCSNRPQQFNGNSKTPCAALKSTEPKRHKPSGSGMVLATSLPLG